MSLNINFDEPRRPRRTETAPTKLPEWVWVAGAAVLAGVVSAVVYLSVWGPVFESAVARSAPRLGQEGVLNWPATENRLVAIDYPAYEEMSKTSVANDKLGLAEMIQTGRLMLVAGRTRVLVLEDHLLTYEIRIQEGPLIGRKGVIGREFVAQ
ncbi:MAG: hypothetical protein P4L84_11250 [Isosphaeraceae bacterium]|nr:hypothetical protein [Isosphaeraceae bacterium]